MQQRGVAMLGPAQRERLHKFKHYFEEDEVYMYTQQMSIINQSIYLFSLLQRSW